MLLSGRVLAWKVPTPQLQTVQKGCAAGCACQECVGHESPTWEGWTKPWLLR